MRIALRKASWATVLFVGTSREFRRALTCGNSDWKSAAMCKSP
jgi:hypothetical protein